MCEAIPEEDLAPHHRLDEIRLNLEAAERTRQAASKGPVAGAGGESSDVPVLNAIPSAHTHQLNELRRSSELREVLEQVT